MQEANTYLQLILQDNEQLTNNFVVYNNLIIKVNFRFENQENEEVTLDQGLKEQLEYCVDNFRSYATRIKIKLNSIKNKINLTKEQQESFDESYKTINSSPLPEVDKCESFVQVVNDILADKIGAYESMMAKQSKQDYTDSALAPNIEDENNE
jgi:Mg2+ and Co2+ transporter CorA